MTAFSRSMIECTGLHGVIANATMLFLHIDYAPSAPDHDPQHEVAARFVSEGGGSWPRDMPTDVLCTLGHGIAVSVHDADRVVAAGADDWEIYLLASLLLRKDEERSSRFRELSVHGDRELRLWAMRAAGSLGDTDALRYFVDHSRAAIAKEARERLAKLAADTR